MAKKNNRPSPALLSELESFLSFVPPGRLSRNLRRMFLLYLSHSQQQHGMDVDFEEQVNDLYFLFEFLDKAEKEIVKRS